MPASACKLPLSPGPRQFSALSQPTFTLSTMLECRVLFPTCLALASSSWAKPPSCVLCPWMASSLRFQASCLSYDLSSGMFKKRYRFIDCGFFLCCYVQSSFLPAFYIQCRSEFMTNSTTWISLLKVCISSPLCLVPKGELTKRGPPSEVFLCWV